MSRNNRKLDYSLYNSLYTRVGDKYGECTYCGIPAEVLDHVPPLSFVHYVSDKTKQSLSFYLVPSCGECNNALGDQPLLTIQERINFVRKHIKKRYAKALRVPYWDEDELKELSRTMREEIRKANTQSSWVKDRIVYTPPDYLFNLTCYKGDVNAER